MLKRLRVKRYIALVLAFLAVILLVQNVQAPAASELEEYLSKQSEYERQKDNLEKEIAANMAQKTAYEQEIARLDGQLRLLGQQITEANKVIGTLGVLIDEANLAIADATVRLNERQAYLESRLRDIYINGDVTMMDVFFSAASFDEAIVLFDMVERIMEQDKAVLDDITEERALIEAEKAKLQEAKEEQEFMLADLEAKDTELSALQEAKAKANNELTMSIEQLRIKYDEADAASAETEKIIKDLLAKMQTKAYYGGVFRWPLPYDKTNVTSEYGPRFHPILKENRMHAGIDIGAPNGTEIYAAGVGEIIFKGWNGGYGNCIIIDHGGSIATLYGHMSRYNDAFGVGDAVTINNVIGYVGTTGQSTGNHLHFEVRVDGKHVDPNPYVGR